MIVTRRVLLRCFVASPLAVAAAAAQESAWKPLFDGVSLKGWKETGFRNRGAVQVRDGVIQLGKGRLTGITWAGDGAELPKTNYEIRFEAMKIDGNDFFAGVTFPVGDSYCTWINGGWGGQTVGLSSIDNQDAAENETSTAKDFEKGRWYAFRLEVTPKRIRAWIDGSLVIDAEIEGRDISLRPGEIDLNTPLGFASYATVAALRKIEYRVLGPGR